MTAKSLPSKLSNGRDLRAGFRVDGRSVYLTDHAIERYGERVRPHLQAHSEIAQDIARLGGVCGHIATEAPEWVHFDWAPDARPPDAWLHCGDVAFPLGLDGRGRYVAITALTRGGISETARANRNARRSARRSARRKRGKMESYLGGRPRPAFGEET